MENELNLNRLYVTSEICDPCPLTDDLDDTWTRFGVLEDEVSIDVDEKPFGGTGDEMRSL